MSFSNFSSEWLSFLKKWLLISLVLHLVCAYFSVGFFHFDEHFQILEFLNYRLGYSSAADLPHEFESAARGWLLPGVCYLLVHFFRTLGIENAAIWATGFRIFSSIIGWLSLVGVALCTESLIPNLFYRKWAVRGLSILYLIPYVHARCSSDSLGGSLFFLAICFYLLVRRGVVTSAICGLLLGLSFQMRYQMAFSIIGFGFWCLCVEKVRFRIIASMAVSFLITLLLGEVVDHWGYGKWSLTFWNYFDLAILQHGSATASTEEWYFQPWYYYILLLIKTAPPVGLAIMLGVIGSWFYYPKNIMTWVTAPFVVAHFLLAHKEPRYLFPILAGVPVALAMTGAYISSRPTAKNPLLTSRSLKICVLLSKSALAVNLLFLLIVCIRPSFAPVCFYYHVLNHHPDLETLYVMGESPYRIIQMPVNFFRPRGLKEYSISSFDKLEEVLKTQRKPFYLFKDQDHLQDHFGVASPLTQASCILEYSTLPRWISALFARLKITSNMCRWSLYRCEVKANSG